MSYSHQASQSGGFLFIFIDKQSKNTHNKPMELVLDTLKVYERLKAADLNDKAAREIAEVLKDVQIEAIKGLATREDLARLREDIAKVEGRLVERITAVEGELKLIKWMLGFVIAGILSLILKSFFV